MRSSEDSSEADTDEIAIPAILDEIGYKEAATLEHSAGDADYLKQMRCRFALILSGE